MKSENRNFMTMKIQLLLEDLDIDNILMSNKISSGENNHKFFIGYRDDDCKIKPLHIMLPITIGDNEILKNMLIFGIKSAMETHLQ